jgi:ubiquinone/menaquinone biosynthesis C-methylase UbiE
VTQSFKELEHAGWMDRAAAYDTYFARITNQAIDPILDSFGSLDGKRLLDVCCGTGEVAAAAAKRGAQAEGLDFASTMVAAAAAKYRDLTFAQGDAENLFHESDRFDCVVCSFGLLHIEPYRLTARSRWDCRQLPRFFALPMLRSVTAR